MIFQTVSHIAEKIDARIEGNPDLMLERLAALEAAREGDLSFLANKKYESQLYTTEASAVIVHEDFVPNEKLELTLLRVADPYSAFAMLQTEVAAKMRPPREGREMPQLVDESARIGEGVYLGAFCYVGKNVVLEKGCQIYPYSYIGDGSVLGENTIVFPHVTIYPETTVGRDCIIHAGARIGGDGFGFAPQADGTFRKIPQLGRVILEDEVEVGANTTIDRATLGETVIRKGAKLDNLVMVAHNVEVGEGTAMAAQSGIAGSSTLGKHCLIGGQAGIAGHIHLEDGITLDAQTGVNSSLSNKHKMYRGAPAHPFRDQLRMEVVSRKLPELLRRIEALERKLASSGLEGVD